MRGKYKKDIICVLKFYLNGKIDFSFDFSQFTTAELLAIKKLATDQYNKTKKNK